MQEPTSKTRVVVVIINLEGEVANLDKVVASRIQVVQGVASAEVIAHTDYIEPIMPASRPIRLV